MNSKRGTQIRGGETGNDLIAGKTLSGHPSIVPSPSLKKTSQEEPPTIQQVFTISTGIKTFCCFPLYFLKTR